MPRRCLPVEQSDEVEHSSELLGPRDLLKQRQQQTFLRARVLDAAPRLVKFCVIVTDMGAIVQPRDELVVILLPHLRHLGTELTRVGLV